MQVNASPPTPKDSEIESKPRPSLAQKGADHELPFSSLFASAEKKSPNLKPVGNNVYRIEDTDESTTDATSDDKKLSRPDQTTIPAPPAIAPTLLFGGDHGAPSIDFKVNSTKIQLSRSGASVMIQVISHIRGISSAYQSVQFDIPDHQVRVKITAIGSSIKISLTASDDALRNELKSNQTDLTHILRRELNSPTLEFSVDTPEQGSSSGSGNGSNTPKKNNSDKDEEGTE